MGVARLVFVLVIFQLILFVDSAEKEKHRSKHDSKKADFKSNKLRKLLENVERVPIPSFLIPDSSSPPMNKQGPVVLAAAFNSKFTKSVAQYFALTLRNTGFTGDLVVGVNPDSRPLFIDVLQKCKTILYKINLECTSHTDDVNNYKCQFKDLPENEKKVSYSVNMIRIFLYKWWLQAYDNNAMVLISDFRDVIFQSNPFTYIPHIWSTPKYQLVIFQEPFPNKMIYRCPFNSNWINQCYGKAGLDKIGYNPVSCSGTVMGSRDGILAYVSTLCGYVLVYTCVI